MKIIESWKAGMIEITREKGWTDKLRKYKVMLNEQEIGTIGPNGVFNYSLHPGLYTLYLKIDWCRSRKIHFEILDNEIVRFSCGGLRDTNFLSMLWYITFKRNRYLWIEQEIV
ncbi:hypothetical protein [Radiobacillus deserti]|uniref:Uncharacterized protein n=1 Tax=Radiobacillus deserti TaxID=2594883 RepID=A0A516KEF0_9BACI|nr:hypothetical protein [Radiobacillus deserti]QDP39768.1 hypothetical protein FN924_06020 [Radiobacillus deserti]